MPETGLRILLDQNVPQDCLAWLQKVRPAWSVWHVNLIGLAGRPGSEVFRWPRSGRPSWSAMTRTFAVARTFPLGAHHGIIRLRVWPTTIELTIGALQRVIDQVPESDLARNLLIVDNQRIRLRRAPV